ncbi:MAG: hypothetical protein M3Y39_16975 [Chloroflexota bacterium]|nr:hypothetical protein [Chloroflexota bacterium]
MAKTSNVPSGYYNGKEAARRLGMPIGTFYHQVKTGKIEKIVPPGSTEGYYPKKAIHKLAQGRELFILLNSIEPMIFKRAESEEDLRGIVDLCIAIYGVGGTPSYEARLEIWKKNPEVYYVVKQEDIVVGYISLIWFDNEALDTLMGPTPNVSRSTSAGTGVYSVTGPEHVLPFTPGQPIDSLFISMGVRPGISNSQQREYGFKLLRDTLYVLVDFARRGMPVKKLYATSEKEDGIRIARKFGMEEIKYPNDILIRFEVDLDKGTGISPIAKQYQEALKELQEI